MTGKEKCELLRQIRKGIAEKNGIDYNPRECTHTGDCQGTCAMCDLEIRYLDAQLNKKAAMGGRLRVAGLALDKVKVETTDSNARRETFPPHVTQTMGIVIPPEIMRSYNMGEKDSNTGSEDDWSWADEDDEV